MPMTRRKLIREILFPLLAALIWGTAFVAQSRAAELLPPMAFSALRSAVAVAFLTPVARLVRKRAERRGTARPSDRRALLVGGALMGLTLAVAVNLQQAGVAGTSVGKAGFISSFYVVLVPVFGVLLGKRARLSVWLGVALAVAGLYLLCLRPGERVLEGLRATDLYLVGCAVFYAVQILIIDHYVQKADGIALAAVQFAVAAAVSALLSLCFEAVVWGNVLLCVGPILYVGILSSGVAYALQILAQEDANPAVVTLLFSLESVFAVLAGALLLGDRLSGREYLGCGLMFAAVILAQIPERGNKMKNEK